MNRVRLIDRLRGAYPGTWVWNANRREYLHKESGRIVFRAVSLLDPESAPIRLYWRDTGEWVWL